MIRFTKVSKQYPRGGPALEHITFHLRRGEFAFLTGPSGAGKSTILKLIYVEQRPTQGEVRVDGKSSVTLTRDEIPRLRRRIGVVFQDFRLLEDRTAAIEGDLAQFVGAAFRGAHVVLHKRPARLQKRPASGQRALLGANAGGYKRCLDKSGIPLPNAWPHTGVRPSSDRRESTG